MKVPRIAIAIILFLLTACNSAVVPIFNQAPHPQDSQPVTIKVWHALGGNGRTALDALVDDFQSPYPSITVALDGKDTEGDLLKFLIAAMAANRLPDVMVASPRTIAEFARRGVLIPLDPWLAHETLGLSGAERSDWIPGLLDSGRLPDQKNLLYALPYDQHAVLLYYNADLLQAAKFSSPPKTWDDFATAARATTRGETRGWAMSPSAPAFGAIVFSRGGDLLDETQTQVQFHHQAGSAAIHLVAALSRGGAAYIADRAKAREDFAHGKTTFLIGTTDELTLIAEATTRTNRAGQWGMAMLPQGDLSRPPRTTLVGSCIAIFRSSDERTRAAWLLARWLTAPEQSAHWSRATLAVPLRVSALGLAARDAGAHPHSRRLRDGLGHTIPNARSLPNVPNAAAIDAAIVEMWNSVGNGADPDVALNRAYILGTRALATAP